MIDATTKAAIRNAADERAASEGYWFDPDAAARVVDFFRRWLKHSKGQWAGKPLELMTWQREELIYPLFGWRKPGRDNPQRRFRIAYVECPKKNTKTTTGTALALYMLVGDREPGAEVYSVAVDREQASLSHREAQNMIEASAELSRLLKIQKTAHNIYYPAAKSYYRTLSNEAASAEGKNAHFVLKDEVHAWRGEELWNSLRYAGRARRQPLSLTITTAGDNPMSVCKQEHDYARRIIEGAAYNPEYFGLIYAADPGDDWTDRRTWEKANPAMGTVFTWESVQGDIQEAKDKPSALAALKRYGLNIWLTGSNPWLSPDAWEACGRQFTAADLEGRRCWAGLDLSRITDTTALALVFEPDERGECRQLVHFWLPSEAADKMRGVVPYHEWAVDGHIELTPGRVLDYEFIRQRFRELAERFNILGMYYDPIYAADLVKQMEEDTGVPAVEFAQTITLFAMPTAEYERRIVAGTLLHNRNPVLTWQAGNVEVKVDVNQNKRPVKPKSHQKIDGIVAGIMALRGWCGEESGECVYESRGILTL